MKKNKEIANDEINLAGIDHNSLVNGLGMRMVIFSQGCNHHCKNCFNKETWDFNGGKKFKIIDVIDIIKKDLPILDGITFSGGDPIEQANKFVQIAKALPKKTNIWLYTGYTWENLIKLCKSNDSINNLLKYLTVIVDGPYIDKLNDGNKYRGSSNQRIIDVQKSLKTSKPIIYKIPK